MTPTLRTFALLLAGAILASPAAAEELDMRALAAFSKGIVFEEREDPIRAYTYYALAEKIDPESSFLKLKLAKVTLELGDLEKARRYAESILDDPRYVARARFLLVEIDYLEKDKEKALATLRGLLQDEDIDRFEVLKMIGRITIELDRNSEALEALESARAIYDGDLYVHYNLGFIYSDAGRLDDAIESFRAAVEVNPGFSGAHLALASLYRHTGMRAEARREYQRVLEIEPGNNLALQDLAELHYEEGGYDAGIALLEPLLLAGGLEDGGILLLGRFYYRAGEYDKALGLFRDLLERMGERPSLLRLISEVEIERGGFRSAYGYLKRLVTIEPGNFDNYVGMLLLAFDLVGGPVEGEGVEIDEIEKLSYLEKAETLVRADSPNDSYIIGSVYRKIGAYAKGERHLLDALSRGPDERRFNLEIASLYEEQERFEEALRHVIHVYEMNPDDPSLGNFYGYLLAEIGRDLDKARELVKKALEKEPENGYFLDSLGWIEFRSGRYDEALVILRRAVEHAEDDPVIWEHLGETYQRLGRVDDAKEAYRRSLALDPGKRRVQEKLDSLIARSPSSE